MKGGCTSENKIYIKQLIKKQKERTIEMKKLLSLLLASAVLLGLCSCGSTDAENPNNTSKNEKLTEENIAGTYKSVGLFIRDEYQLNENTTFDSTKGNKGTYRLQDKNSIYVKAKNDAADILTRKGKFYYVTDENHLIKKTKNTNCSPLLTKTADQIKVSRRERATGITILNFSICT